MTALVERDVVAAVPRGVWIGGQWRETGATLAVEDPSTGEVLTLVVSNAAAPFGGVKASGIGREGIEEFLDMKYVAMAT